MENPHIVEYDKYCDKCKYKNIKDTEDPCDECLGSPVRESSKRPINWKKSEK